MIDVVIPTQFAEDRFWSLVHQIKSSLHQGVDARVIILCSRENWESNEGKLMSELSTFEQNNTQVFTHRDGVKGDPYNTKEGYMCLPAINAYMQQPREKLGDWQMHAADDDCLTPWALKCLLKPTIGNPANLGMVMGRAVAVTRNYEDRRDWLLGNEIVRCHIDLACGIINTDRLRSLTPPWINIFTGYSDWECIARQAAHFPYVLIPQIVSIKPLTL